MNISHLYFLFCFLWFLSGLAYDTQQPPCRVTLAPFPRRKIRSLREGVLRSLLLCWSTGEKDTPESCSHAQFSVHTHFCMASSRPVAWFRDAGAVPGPEDVFCSPVCRLRIIILVPHPQPPGGGQASFCRQAEWAGTLGCTSGPEHTAGCPYPIPFYRDNQGTHVSSIKAWKATL